MSNNFDAQVQRNLLGKQLEKDGRVVDAMALYEANISEDFEGSFPYRGLAILYRKRKLLYEEVRVLEKAISVFDSLISSGRSDIMPKLNEFKEGLNKAQDKLSKFK
jgi:tetratricopeptide (TPR) repeat protein